MPMSILLFIMVMLTVIPLSSSEIHTTTLRSDPRAIIPLDEFSFTHNGALELSTTSISLHPTPSPSTDLSLLGFLLSTRDAWPHVLDQLLSSNISCPLHSNLITLIYTLNRLDYPNSTSFTAHTNLSHPDRFTLLFANCLTDTRVSFSLRSAMYNLDPKTRSPSYLSVGSTILPRIFFALFLVYASLSAFWSLLLYRNRLSAFRIHYFMLVLLLLKSLNLVSEAEDLSFTERTGSAHGWDVLFYFFSFLKGISLFTVIVLIGTGWSFLKPCLQDKEKKVLMFVIPLQIIANIAQVALSEGGPYDNGSITWNQIFVLVDVVCCCAVLFPIVWSIRNLRDAAKTDGKAAVNLMKLMLFRQYYVVVICYIYFTRVVVYALVTITSYRYLWTSVVAGEVATLGFYVFTGYKFKPEAHNPYFVVKEDEEAAALDALKMDDDFEL